MEILRLVKCKIHEGIILQVRNRVRLKNIWVWVWAKDLVCGMICMGVMRFMWVQKMV